MRVSARGRGQWLRAGVAALLVFTLAGCSGRRTDGPVTTPGPHGMTLPPVELGAEFTYGLEILFVTGNDDVTIDGVELLRGDEEMSLVDARIADETRPVNFAGDTTYPPTSFAVGNTVEASGAVLHPETQQSEGLAGYQLLLVLRLNEPGAWTREIVRVSYEAGGERYVWESPAQITACTHDYANADGTCPEPPDPDWIDG